MFNSLNLKRYLQLRSRIRDLKRRLTKCRNHAATHMCAMWAQSEDYVDPEWSSRRLAKATAPLFGLERTLLEAYYELRKYRGVVTNYNWFSARDSALVKIQLLAAEQQLSKVTATIEAVEANNRAILRAAERPAL